MRLFGGAKKTAAPEAKSNAAVQSGLQRIHDTIEMLDKRERLCEKKIEEQLVKARAFNHAGKRNQALMALKTKKLYEKEQIKISNVRQNLITQQTYLESAASDVEALNALKAGADALKAQHAGLNTQKVEDLMEEIDEQMALKNEVAEVISRPFAGTDVDEDELSNELDLMMEQEAQEQMAAVEPEPMLDLPAVPTHVPVAAKPAAVAAKPAKAKVAVAADDDDFGDLRQAMSSKS